MKQKETQLSLLAQSVIEQKIGAELASLATQLVFGSGNSNATIMIIGEAPGAKEDIAGEPFIGPSGKLLNELLATISIERDEVYITNIVKYRPPKNRDPTTQEKAAFWPVLLRQIEIIQPKVLVTLGRHSMSYFLPNDTIGTVHGVMQKCTAGAWSGMLLPLYHPAAAIYNRALRSTLFDDMAALKKYAK